MPQPETTAPTEWVIRARFAATETQANALADEVVDLVLGRFPGAVVSIGPDKKESNDGQS